MKNINIAVIGTGFMGKTHSYAISNLKYFYKDLPFNAVLHTVCTSNIEKAQNAELTYGFKHSTDDFKSIVENDEIDVIDICTPNASHASQILMSLNAYKDIYCEKPVVVNRDEIISVKKLLDKSNVVHRVVFNNRFFPATMKAKKLFSEGKIGNVLTFSVKYLHSSGLGVKQKGWRDDKEKSGGGVLLDLGSHAIDMFNYITETDKQNEIESVTGISHIFNNQRTDCDEAFIVLAKLRNKTIGTIEVSKIALGTNDDFSFEIYGDKGSIKFSLMEPNYLYYHDGNDSGFTKIDSIGKYESPGGMFPSSKAPVGWLQGHVHSMYSFLDSVYRRDNTCKPSLYDGLKVNCIMEAAYLSDKTGKQEFVEYI